MTETLGTIPPHILSRVACHVAALHAWNASITQARAMEAIAGQPGRYEYDLIYTDAGRTLYTRTCAATLALQTLEDDASAYGIARTALYAACGGKPALLGEGDAVQKWRREENNTTEKEQMLPTRK